MAAAKGRELLVKRGSSVIAGIRTKGVAFNGEAIDVTTDDDSGYRTMLADAGTYSVDLSIEGITKDNDLRSVVMAAGSLMLTDITIEYPNGDELSGNFFLTSLEESGTYNDAVTFSGSLQSSGTFTFTAASS
jgi:predicted secreted protein